ncbi:hypothetical protein [Streptomyces sp. NPDC006784]|uniref:hypothetical protein n=1 Tax=Streptomyces sp. NPDC006784 TaxID=3364764 RepID=UPI0036C36C93
MNNPGPSPDCGEGWAFARRVLTDPARQRETLASLDRALDGITPTPVPDTFRARQGAAMTDPTVTDLLRELYEYAGHGYHCDNVAPETAQTYEEWLSDTAHDRPAVAAAKQAARAQQPPPPGSTREQLPDHLLALIDVPPYTSTACETAHECERVVDVHTEHAEELRTAAAGQLHDRCRRNNKFTGVTCGCACHQAKEQP